MIKYLISRLLRGLISVTVVIAVIMVLIYTCLDKQAIFAADPSFAKQKSNNRSVYMMEQWEKYGYLDYVSYGEYLQEKLAAGSLSSEDYTAAAKLGKTAQADGPLTAELVGEFTQVYRGKGYTVERLEGLTVGNSKKYREGGSPRLYAYRDVPVTTRLWKYITGLVTLDNIHAVKDDVGERKLTFTLFDPAYGGETFSPAIMGNGTLHKYLLYFDDRFPFVHQNLVTLNLGVSYSVNKGVDVFDTMTQPQGALTEAEVTYPTGIREVTADDLHTAIYAAGSRAAGALNQKYYVDDYTNVQTLKSGMSKMGYSFVIGIIAVALAYLLAVPLGILMALRKDAPVDRLGTLYIVFITAVPSLAYIFIFKAIGNRLGLPTTFNMQQPTTLMYVLPIVSLALPSAANLMKWLRRYMIDQLSSDYVKFARSSGVSAGKIFAGHVLKNAAIPIVHGIPAGLLLSLTGAIITERVYVVPGVGNVLTTAINQNDNGVIVGVALFYGVLTVTSVILGDVLMSLMDPRISFTAKRGAK